MKIGRSGEPEVADVVRAVLRLHHRAQKQRVERLLLRPSLELVEKLVEICRRGLLRQLESVGAGELRERLELLLVGLIVDPVDRGKTASVEEAGHRLVGREH